MAADESFPKALQSLTTWVSVNTNLYRKLVLPLQSQITFDESSFSTNFHSWFNLLIWGLDNFTFNTLMVPCEQSKIVSFESSILKRIVAYRPRLPVKLIFCIVFGSDQMIVVHLNLLLSSYNIFWNNYNLANN